MILTAHRWIWTFYLLTISVIVLSVVVASRGDVPGGDPWRFLLVHVALLGACFGVVRLFRGGWPAALATGAYSVVGLPLVFSSLGLVLPAIHPEPYEWVWVAADRALFGTDPTVWLQRVLWPPFTELMQLCYAAFYFVPIAAIAASGVVSGRAAFERAQVLVVFGFQLSYLGYALWPTLPPYRFLWHERPIEGVWLTERVNTLLYEAEFNRWDCFPSGHTMLSVLSLVLAWRYARPVFWVLLPIVAVLVLSTMALRYHYAVDVLAGLAGVPLALWLGKRVMGEAPAERGVLDPRAET